MSDAVHQVRTAAARRAGRGWSRTDSPRDWTCRAILLARHRERAPRIARHVRRLDQLRADRHPDDLRFAVACAELVDATTATQDPGRLFGRGNASAAMARLLDAALATSAAMNAAGHGCEPGVPQARPGPPAPVDGESLVW